MISGALLRRSGSCSFDGDVSQSRDRRASLRSLRHARSMCFTAFSTSVFDSLQQCEVRQDFPCSSHRAAQRGSSACSCYWAQTSPPSECRGTDASTAECGISRSNAPMVVRSHFATVSWRRAWSCFISEFTVSPAAFKGMKWHGKGLGRCSSGTSVMRAHSLQGSRRCGSRKFTHVGESKKISFGFFMPAGWPYLPCSRNLNSARNTSRRTRKAVKLHFPFLSPILQL